MTWQGDAPCVPAILSRFRCDNEAGDDKERLADQRGGGGDGARARGSRRTRGGEEEEEGKRLIVQCSLALNVISLLRCSRQRCRRRRRGWQVASR
eukprot:768658-Hanusia_phi.AAC.6